MEKIVFVDSEINSKQQISDLGAIKADGAMFHQNNPDAFKLFVRDSTFVVGHNILNHDIHYIKALLPSNCVIIDTLFLSPLLFPNRPYHNLVKDDKIENDDVNNPLSDSKKCRDVFYDELSTFNTLPPKLKDIYGELLFRTKEFGGFFKHISFRHSFFANVKGWIRDYFSGSICQNANLDKLIKETPIELAYALALITAEDKKSITPPWVLHVFPKIQRVIHELRYINCNDSKCSYCSSAFDAKKKLKEYFGYTDFRTYEGENLQEKAVNAALNGKSLLAVFPTGGGKSLTFQLPALMEGEAVRGLTVVISPLQSLMKDQVDNLEKKTISGAVTINGLLSPIERAESIRQIREGNASLLYIAPESLRSKTVEKLLLQREIARFVIDEAHCFSAWGQDFRVDYLFIAEYIKHLQKKKQLEKAIPVSCFTATAKQKVISDICTYFRENLGLELEVLASNATRTNLRYKVIYQDSPETKYATLRDLLMTKNVPSIVYVARVKESEMLAERLNQDGISALAFNGKMDKNEKVTNQDSFMNNEVQVIVATSAFGMGVDKSDVKLVIHYDISDSLENYVQEAGRAGRDQNIQAECYILYNESDLDKHFLLLNQTKLTLSEIQQVWKAIKNMTSKGRKTMSASALEIAREAGWSEEKHDIETRVRSALSALEQSHYLKRKMNSPRVFATGVLVKSFQEASDIIDRAKIFDNDEQKTDAKRIIKRIISARAISKVDGEAESRVDYISDELGIPRLDVEESISRMKTLGILADTQDMNAYIKKNEKNRTINNVEKFVTLESYMLDHIFEYGVKVDLKEFNDRAQKDGIKGASIQNIRTVIFFWTLKELVKIHRNDNIYQLSTEKTIDFIREKSFNRLKLAKNIAVYLFAKAKNPDKNEELVEFSLLALTNYLKENATEFGIEGSIDEKDVSDAILYLQKTGTIDLEGGFLVFYNSLNIERIILDNHISYKKDDYNNLHDYYQLKTQQIHIVGEYANMMLRSYDDSLVYVKDYFSMEYSGFIKKYFKGRQRTGEILRNMTPQKYNKLFGDLSEVQRTIIDDDQSQYISVIAGPGSGKTRVLVHKLAALLSLEDVKAEQLLMLTFSRMAAREFKDRLRQLVETAADYVEIKTFHSYCFDLLGKIANEEDLAQVVSIAATMIENKEVEHDKISKTVLVIDEAQDINEDEFKLIVALIRENPEMKIIAVGDDDQNINEFRGADSKYLESLITELNATKYEMVENYRSKQTIVSFANQFARTIRKRLKTQAIVSKREELGQLEIVEHQGQNLEIPVFKDYLNRRLRGTTAILTVTNESALKLVGMLVKQGIDAKLIQSDDNLNLYNLLEIRYFIKSIEKCNSPIVDENTWVEAKEKLKKNYEKSSVLKDVLKVIESFEKENKGRYKNDFINMIRESSFSDFEDYDKHQVIVSTIHKAKGREFENVYMLIDSAYTSSDEEKRRLYVGITRAKTNLFIHIANDGLKTLAQRLKVPYNVDPESYLEPENMEIQLGYRDVFLGYFEYHKKEIMELRSGTLLKWDEFYLTYNNNKILKFSKSFYENILCPLIEKGYRIIKSEIRYIVAWKDKDKEDSEEIAVILPNIYLKRETNADEALIQLDFQEENKPSSDNEIALLPQINQVEVMKKQKNNASELTPDEIAEIQETDFFKELRETRMRFAKEERVAPFFVFDNSTLINIYFKKPTSMEELLNCGGVEKAKVKKYGEAFLEVVKKFDK